MGGTTSEYLLQLEISRSWTWQICTAAIILSLVGQHLGWDGAGLGNFSRFKTDLHAYHSFNGAMNIDIGKWQHICSAYSYSLDMYHMYQNGLKVFSFNYTGDVKYNMKGMFQNLIFAQNIDYDCG